MAHAPFDPEKDPAEDGGTGALKHGLRDQAQQGRLADLHREGCHATQAIGIGLESRFQSEIKVVDDAQAFEFAVESTHENGVILVHDF